jgi:CTP synthase
MELHDAYKSVWEALYHGGIANDAAVELVKIDSSTLEHDDASVDRILGAVDGILVPGGFGERGIEGMIRAARWAREHKVPYFGICLGMQIMVIEYARTMLGWADSHSSEFDPDTPRPVVGLLEDQIDVKAYGGTMRLGASLSILEPGSRIHEVYGTDTISERHRHRYEVSNAYRQALEAAGLRITSTTEDGSLVEAVEWPDNPWSIGVQFHPEFKSRPVAAHPLFSGFIAACLARHEASAVDSAAAGA